MDRAGWAGARHAAEETIFSARTGEHMQRRKRLNVCRDELWGSVEEIDVSGRWRRVVKLRVHVLEEKRREEEEERSGS